MKKQSSQVEKNLSASFGYVRKDILMLNDNFTELHNKFQQFLSQYEILVDEVKEIKEKINKGSKKNVRKIRSSKTKKSNNEKTTTKSKVPKKKENKRSSDKLYLDYEVLKE